MVCDLLFYFVDIVLWRCMAVYVGSDLVTAGVGT